MSDSGSTSKRQFVFSGVLIRSPMEVLKTISDKKIQTLSNLGDEENADLYRLAYELASSSLAKVSGEEV